MPTIRRTQSLTANQVVDNVLQGSQFEFIQVPSRVQIYAVYQVTAAGVGEVEVFFGQELQCSQEAPNVVTAGGPTVPDDIIVDDYAAPGDRLVVRVVETAGGTADVRILVKITPRPM